MSITRLRSDVLLNLRPAPHKRIHEKQNKLEKTKKPSIIGKIIGPRLKLAFDIFR